MHERAFSLIAFGSQTTTTPGSSGIPGKAAGGAAWPAVTQADENAARRPLGLACGDLFARHLGRIQRVPGKAAGGAAWPAVTQADENAARRPLGLACGD
ncbi:MULTISPECIES: hypothetical protein [unclassified Frankia]|uniref:hypothetical protein n=1 Tax=unclassified Frankia TaxID=2632575 RepID=UPI001EF5E5B4|nr:MULTISPECIES: hypothetical protein [unclassified Frankia]